jgi:hypothetical protein
VDFAIAADFDDKAHDGGDEKGVKEGQRMALRAYVVVWGGMWSGVEWCGSSKAVFGYVFGVVWVMFVCL